MKNGACLDSLFADDEPALVPVVPRARCSAGDVWECGRHRLFCADSSDVESVKRFLDPMISNVAKNEYFQVNTEQAFGLPEHAQEHAGHPWGSTYRTH